MLTAYDWPHHDCLFDYFAIRSGCVSTQRLHHCVSAWPHGQTLFLTLGSLTARVARRAAICHLHFSLALRPSMISILRPAHRPRCAARQHASSIAITMLSLWLAAFKLLSSYLAIRNGCVSTATVPIAFKLGLAAKRSLYHLDRLPPALRGVQRLANCILAWPYGQACFLSFGPLTARVARRVGVPQL